MDTDKQVGATPYSLFIVLGAKTYLSGHIPILQGNNIGLLINVIGASVSIFRAMHNERACYVSTYVCQYLNPSLIYL